MTVASRDSRDFTEREIHLLEAIGAWSGTAIENARLHRQARRLAVLEERERIGMDLHDGIIQSIYGVGLALEYARMAVKEDPDLTREKISQSIDGLNEAIRDLRAYILDLNPRQLQNEETLKQGIQRLLAEFRANTLAESNLITSEDGWVEMPRERALALFHICQEALANVAKHARASKAEVHLWSTDERALIEVIDDGRGFDVRKKNATLGHGLSNMARRARKVGGDVEISSHPMGGTTVLAWVPWEKNETPQDPSNTLLAD
jgi:signal transduction histidine kinase